MPRHAMHRPEILCRPLFSLLPPLLLTLQLLVAASPGPTRAQMTIDRSIAVDSRELTIYTREIAEIQEIRTVELEKGQNSLRLLDISPNIIEGSVNVEPIDFGVNTRSVAYTGQAFDLEGYWRARIGETVEVVKVKGDKVKGVLRMVQEDKLFLEDPKDAGVLIVVDRDDIDETRLESLPPQLTTGPSLLWTCDAAKGGKLKLRLSYLTSGLYWVGQHQVSLTGESAGVRAAAEVVNETGMNLRYDGITFIGGAIHLAGDKRRVDRVNPKPGAMAGGTETSFGDVRRWTVTGAGILLAGHNTRIAFVAANPENVKRSYVYDATIFDDRISAHLEFTMPDALPAGDVRVYELREGHNLFIGEDRIDDTPPGSPVNLDVGQVFDLTAERDRMEEGRGESGNTRQTFQVVLGNSGAMDVTVRVLERLFGDWSIPSATLDGAAIETMKIDARTAAFDVPVPAGNTVTLNYEIMYER